MFYLIMLHLIYSLLNWVTYCWPITPKYNNNNHNKNSAYPLPSSPYTLANSLKHHWETRRVFRSKAGGPGNGSYFTF